MSFAGLLVRDVAIIHPGWRADQYGDMQPDWTTATTVASPGWLFQRSTFEDVNGRNAASASMHLSLPAGTQITHQDRVRIDGVVYELTGAPLAAWTPRGEHHVECDLTVVDG